MMTLDRINASAARPVHAVRPPHTPLPCRSCPCSRSRCRRRRCAPTCCRTHSSTPRCRWTSWRRCSSCRTSRWGREGNRAALVRPVRHGQAFAALQSSVGQGTTVWLLVCDHHVIVSVGRGLVADLLDRQQDDDRGGAARQLGPAHAHHRAHSLGVIAPAGKRIARIKEHAAMPRWGLQRSDGGPRAVHVMGCVLGSAWPLQISGKVQRRTLQRAVDNVSL